MCGIVGYVGHRACLGILIEGLKRLEYRGYDSAGVALQEDGGLRVIKAAGKIRELEARIGREAHPAQQGIAHTRWATHGEPNDANAHPHTDPDRPDRARAQRHHRELRHAQERRSRPRATASAPRPTPRCSPT